MKALLLKDIYLTKKFSNIIMIICVWLYCWMLGLDQATDESSMFRIILAPLMMVTFSISYLRLVAVNTNIFWCTFPYSKKDKASEIYAVSLFVFVSSLIIASLSYLIFGLLFGELSLITYITLILEITFIFLMLFAIVGLFVCLSAKSSADFKEILCAVTIVGIRFAITKLLLDNSVLVWAILAAVALISFVASWIISVKFYKEKEIKI